MKTKPIHEREPYQIRGSCLEVYPEKGCGFLEAVFQECLELEPGLQGVPFVAPPEPSLSFKGVPRKRRYKPDFVCFGRVLVELKAVSKLADEHRAQVLNHLHTTGLRVGLLVNFGHHPLVEIERIVV